MLWLELSFPQPKLRKFTGLKVFENIQFYEKRYYVYFLYNFTKKNFILSLIELFYKGAVSVIESDPPCPIYYSNLETI